MSALPDRRVPLDLPGQLARPVPTDRRVPKGPPVLRATLAQSVLRAKWVQQDRRDPPDPRALLEPLVLRAHRGLPDFRDRQGLRGRPGRRDLRG